MECKVFTYTRATDPLLYECLNACEQSYYTKSETNSVVRTVGDWTVVGISGTWLTTVQRTRDYLTLDAIVVAESVDAIQNHRLYKAIREAVLEVIRSHPNVRLALTGHSAGGCVAALIATEVQTLCRECTCITFNAFLNVTISHRLLALADPEALELLLFYTVEDITIPIIRPAIPRLENRGFMRWVIPNFQDEALPVHILRSNFLGREPLVAYSTVAACVKTAAMSEFVRRMSVAMSPAYVLSGSSGLSPASGSSGSSSGSVDKANGPRLSVIAIVAIISVVIVLVAVKVP